jgi:RHS repeat-associated protein
MTKYDQFGRVAYTGILSDSNSRSTLQNQIADLVIYDARHSVGFVRNGLNVYYTCVYFTPESILSVNYYDSYPQYSFNPAFPTSILGEPTLTETPTTEGLSTKSLPVMSLVKNIEDDNWTKSYSYYDKKGRTIGTYSINHLGGYTKTESKLDFAGVVQNTNTYHVRKQGETGVTVKERFAYDNQNRLLQHYHQVDSKPEVLLAENTYNELSQLANKKVGNNLQSIDYEYNIRGWLTDINKNQMNMSDLGGKLFSYKIKYTQKDGIDNPDSVLFPGKNVVPKYNGNIAEVDWRTIEENSSTTPKRYGYVYDKLNRLTAGYYQNPDNPYNKESTESLSYDLNGNIAGLYRTSIPEFGNTTATVIDNLEYIYEGGNQVARVNDYSQNTSGYEGGGGTIHYDLNGNMDIMPDKNINKITYNFLNLPKKVEYGGGIASIDYLYNAGGIKLQKKSPRTECGIVNCNTFTDVTDYLDGFQYLSSLSSGSGGSGDPSEMQAFSTESSKAMEIQAYSLESLNTTTLGAKTPDLQFFPTAEGFYDYKKDLYIYQYKDHLGNVRVSFTRTSAGILEVMDNNDFYPFGMNHFGTGSAMFGAGSYKNYKYNGKELQETGMYDYGARFYMADIGRWGVVDALSEKYRRHSVYNYAVNNPLRFIDPDGNGVEDRVSSIYSSDYNRAYAWGADRGLLALNGLTVPPDDHFNQFGKYLYTDKRKTNNIVIDFQNPITGSLNTAPWLSTELKDYKFDKSNYSTLTNIAKHYAKEVGIETTSLHNGNFSVADEIVDHYEGNVKYGYINKFNDGNKVSFLEADAIMSTNPATKIVSFDIENGKVSSELNDKYNFMSVLKHEASDYGHLKNPKKTELEVYKSQMNDPLFIKTTPDFKKSHSGAMDLYKK